MSLLDFIYEHTTLPAPWDISKIRPQLKFCMRNRCDVTFSYDDTTHKLYVQQHIRLAKRFIFVTHGFWSTIEAEWLVNLKNAVFKLELSTGENSVIVLVGWGGGANLFPWQYPQAASNTQAVGVWLGQTVKEICNWNQRSLPRMEFQRSFETSSVPEIIGIGYSLGAHLMGAAGRASQVFDVITGLDPAGPCFETSNIDKSLSKNDAKFVQVIHSDGFYTYFAYVGISHYGTLRPMGHVDFYPNWGYEQPGMIRTFCGSHRRVLDLFIWSIANPGKFVTYTKLRCQPNAHQKPEKEVNEISVRVEMGYHASKINNGCYYIKTNNKEQWHYTETV